MAHHRRHDEDESDIAGEAKQRAKKTRKNIESGGRFKPPEGATTLRILETPADKERDSPAIFLEYQTHMDVGPNKRFARCGNKPGETGNCWLCKRAIKKEKEGRIKEAAKLAPRGQLAVQVAVLDKDMGEMVGPLLWEMPSGKSAKAMGYKIMGVISSDRRNYTHHRKGYNIDIRRKGTGINTEWGDIDHDEPSKVPKGILKRLKPFVDAGMPSYDEEWQKDVYYGRDKSNKEKDDMANKKKKDEEEDESSDVSSVDESSDESTDDSDESDAKPKKKKKKSKKDDSDESSSDSDASSSDESSDEDDSDEDESDEKPKKKKKKSKKDDSDESDDSDASSDESADESSDESSDDSDDDESDEKPKKRKKPGPKPKKRKKPGPKPKKKKK